MTIAVSIYVSNLFYWTKFGGTSFKRNTGLRVRLLIPFLLEPPNHDGKSGDTAELFEKVSHGIKVKRYNGAINDLNAVIEADPSLSEAYWHRASVLRGLCRYEESEKSYKKFLEMKPGNSVVEKEFSQLHQSRSALDSANNFFDSGDYTKALDFIEKVVLIFSPACSQAKILKVKLLLAAKYYSGAFSEAGFILKENEDDLDA